MSLLQQQNGYSLQDIALGPAASATQNGCKLCTPLGAALVFKGIRGAVPLLHGSQGCSTYIRRYLISHFKEPVDIACSNFGEQTAVFGGGINLQVAIDNICRQYDPSLIGVATTCLSETIGDDVPMFIKQYRASQMYAKIPPIVHVSTPSYQGTHMEGFHSAVRATVAHLATRESFDPMRINLFPGFLSPEDIRHVKNTISAFELEPMILPDYSQTLDGGLWESYQRIPVGGTPVSSIVRAGDAAISIEFGHTLSRAKETTATYLSRQFGVQAVRLGFPIGIRHTDAWLNVLGTIRGRPIPEYLREQRSRLIDALVDGHKHVNTMRAVVFGEEDLVVGLSAFLAEIGIHPVVCASGGLSGYLDEAVRAVVPSPWHKEMCVLENADFATIEAAAVEAEPDLIIGHSKGYAMARRLRIPLVRVGFPIHDRMGGPRLLHVGYDGAMDLFDRIANALIEYRQDGSEVGYTYM
ncbi:MAG: nitrogenase component 1 [Thermodesulfobacteriota bacterium]